MIKIIFIAVWNVVLGIISNGLFETIKKLLEGNRPDPPLETVLLEIDYSNFNDIQYNMRMEILYKFSFLWLLVDQLPKGGWGKSLSAWMDQNWKGSNDYTTNFIIEQHGGVESTIMGFFIYYNNYINDNNKYNHDNSKICTNFKDYLNEIYNPVNGAFETYSLKQHVISISTGLRHTALGILGMLLINQIEKGTYRGKITKSLNYLFSRPENQYKDDRCDTLLFFLINYIACHLKKKSCIFNNYKTPASIVRKIKYWQKKIKPYMAEKILDNSSFEPIPAIKGEPEISVYPFFIPYAGFYRMTNYSFLTACLFLTEDLSDDVFERIKRCLSNILDQYTTLFSEDRYEKNDALKPRNRGVSAWPSKFNPKNSYLPDIGHTAMILAILSQDIVKTKIIPALGKSIMNIEIFHFLVQDVIELFDRYWISPELFDYTYSINLSYILFLHKNTNDILEYEHKVEKLISEEGISEKSISDFINNEILLPELHAHKIPPHVYSKSLTALLIDRIKPGLYPQEKFLEDNKDSFIQNTLTVYEDEEFVKKFITMWQTKPMEYVGGAFLNYVSAAGGKQILDLGSGPGQNARYFEQQGFKVTLFDGSHQMLQEAKKLLNRSEKTCGKDCQSCKLCIHKNILDIRQIDKKYDGIWCSAALVHFPKDIIKNHILPALYDLLTDNGVLMINMAIQNHRLVAHDGRYFEFWYDKKTFMQAIENSKFTIKTVITDYIEQNTYTEPSLRNRWENVICVKNEEKKKHEYIFNLVSNAYNISYEQYIKIHGPNTSSNAITSVHSILKLENPDLSQVKLLDAGCGPGFYAIDFARLGINVTGVDISSKMIDFARQEAGKYNLEDRCSFKVLNYSSLSMFADKSFDCIFCQASFHHIPNIDNLPLTTLKEFYRVLSDRGILFISIQVERAKGFEPDGRYTESYDKKSVDKIIQNAGFKTYVIEDFILPKGQNAYQRNIEFKFYDLYLRKDIENSAR